MANREKPKKDPMPHMTADQAPAPAPSRLRDANEQLTLAALQAQERAEESASRYRDLVEGLDAIVWEANADPWEYTFVSQRAHAILGYPVERWLREPNFWMDLIHPEDRAQAVSAWKTAASARRDFRIDYRTIASDGRIVWLAMIARVRQHEHHPAQFRGLLLDVGDSLRAEMLQTLVAHQTAELLARQEQLRALATELTLSEYRERTKLATELHDHLSQLLVLGLLQLGQAKKVLGSSPNVPIFIEQTEDVLNASLDYTRTLVADLSPPVLQELGLPAALRWLAEYMRRYQLAVGIETPESPSITEGQAVLLFQSVRELLINIAKHARIDRAAVRLHCEHGIMRIEVQDAGCGFDLLYAGTSALAAHTTTPPTASKFGLFAIRERMKALGGAFEMESAPGKGTTATLILPVGVSIESNRVDAVFSEQPTSSPSSVSSPRRQRSPQEHTPATIRVLLVDDHAMLRQGLRILVDGYGHLQVVGEASNGMEAINAVRMLKPDVVVMDINMPQMNGIEATRRIKEEFPNTAVIGLSVLEGIHIEKMMKDAGISGYLTKESAVDELCHAIENAMKGTGTGI